MIKKIFLFLGKNYSFIRTVKASVQLIEIFPQAEGENVENYNIRLQALPKFLSELDKIQDLQFNDIFEKNSLKHEEIKVRSSTD